MSITPLSPSLRGVAYVALTGIGYYIVILVSLHFLRPDVNPISQFTSNYAIGSFGFLMTTAFFGLSLGSLALVIGLYQAISQRARSMIGLVFLSLWAVGLIIAGLFPLDPNVPQQATMARISQVNAPLHVLSLAIGAILVSRRFKQGDNWRSLHRSALILSVFMLVLFIVVAFTTATGSEFAGLGQRVFIVTALTWLLLIATRLRSIATKAVSA